MNKSLLKSFLGLFAASMMFACGDKPNDPVAPNPPAPGGNEIFAPTVSNVVFDGFKANITPKDKSQTYYSGYAIKAEFDSFSSDEAFIKTEIEYIKKDAADGGVSLEFALDATLEKGDTEWTLAKGLDADTEYYLYAYDLNKEAKSNGHLEKVIFKTPAAPTVVMSDVTFKFEEIAYTTTTAKYVVTPSKDDVMYYVGIVSKVQYVEFGEKPEKLVELVLSELSKFAAANGVTVGRVMRLNSKAGVRTFMESNLKPATKYVVFAIGFDSQGRPISAAHTNEFVTLNEASTEVSVGFSVKVYDGDVLAADHSAYSWAEGMAVIGVTPTLKAGATTCAYMMFVTDDMGTDVQTKAEIVAETDTDRKLGAFGVTYTYWDISYTAAGYGIDDKGNTGDLVKETVMLSKDNISPIADLYKNMGLTPATPMGKYIKEITKPVVKNVVKFELPTRR